MKVVVVLEHKALGRIAAHRVVRRTYLQQLVESRDEVESAQSREIGQSRGHQVVLELHIAIADVQAYRNPLDQIAQLAKDVLCQKRPIVAERFNVCRDCIGGAQDLLIDSAHSKGNPP